MTRVMSETAWGKPNTSHVLRFVIFGQLGVVDCGIVFELIMPHILYDLNNGFRVTHKAYGFGGVPSGAAQVRTVPFKAVSRTAL